MLTAVLSSKMYYLGRFLQLLGMWLLLVAVVVAGPWGPSPRVFGLGVVIFVIGWLLVRRTSRSV